MTPRKNGSAVPPARTRRPHFFSRWTLPHAPLRPDNAVRFNSYTHTTSSLDTPHRLRLSLPHVCFPASRAPISSSPPFARSNLRVLSIARPTEPSKGSLFVVPLLASSSSSGSRALAQNKEEMASQLDVVRGLKIKTNTLKRLKKELGYYEMEREREAARVDKMKAEGADEHDVRQAVSCVWGGGRAPSGGGVCARARVRLWPAQRWWRWRRRQIDAKNTCASPPPARPRHLLQRPTTTQSTNQTNTRRTSPPSRR